MRLNSSTFNGASLNGAPLKYVIAAVLGIAASSYDVTANAVYAPKVTAVAQSTSATIVNRITRDEGLHNTATAGTFSAFSESQRSIIAGARTSTTPITAIVQRVASTNPSSVATLAVTDARLAHRGGIYATATGAVGIEPRVALTTSFRTSALSACIFEPRFAVTNSVDSSAETGSAIAAINTAVSIVTGTCTTKGCITETQVDRVVALDILGSTGAESVDAVVLRVIGIQNTAMTNAAISGVRYAVSSTTAQSETATSFGARLALVPTLVEHAANATASFGARLAVSAEPATHSAITTADITLSYIAGASLNAGATSSSQIVATVDRVCGVNNTTASTTHIAAFAERITSITTSDGTNAEFAPVRSAVVALTTDTATSCTVGVIRSAICGTQARAETTLKASTAVTYKFRTTQVATTTSWWLDQRIYTDSSITKAMTYAGFFQNVTRQAGSRSKTYATTSINAVALAGTSPATAERTMVVPELTTVMTAPELTTIMIAG